MRKPCGDLDAFQTLCIVNYHLVLEAAFHNIVQQHRNLKGQEQVGDGILSDAIERISHIEGKHYAVADSPFLTLNCHLGCLGDSQDSIHRRFAFSETELIAWQTICILSTLLQFVEDDPLKHFSRGI